MKVQVTDIRFLNPVGGASEIKITTVLEHKGSVYYQTFARELYQGSGDSRRPFSEALNEICRALDDHTEERRFEYLGSDGRLHCIVECPECGNLTEEVSNVENED